MAFDILSFVIGQQTAKGSGGGGGGTIVAKKGTFNASGTTHTLNHGLGVVPSFIWVYPTTGLVTSTLSGDEIIFGVGVNQKVADALGTTSGIQYGKNWNKSLGTEAQNSREYPIDTTYDWRVFFRNANEATITIGSDGLKLISGTNYSWLAVGIAE